MKLPLASPDKSTSKPRQTPLSHPSMDAIEIAAKMLARRAMRESATTTAEAWGLHWVRLNKYCADTGDTPDGVDKRLRTGKWLHGIHARVPAGSASLWINLKAVNDWAEGKKPAYLHGQGK